MTHALTSLPSDAGTGFVSQKLLDSLTEKIAIEYLKLPIVIWVCLSQLQNKVDLLRLSW